MYVKNIILSLFLLVSVTVFAQNEREYTTYIVKQGETLRSIAKKVGCRYRDIKNLNPDVDKKHPKVNTTLVVPNKNFHKKTPDKKETQKPQKPVIHTVKKGETFYRIAKKYNVTIQSLKDTNPQTQGGLQPGMKIRIPFKEEFTVHPQKQKALLYKVQKGDTKWRIAQKYHISITDLERLNPFIKEGLKEGQLIIVQKSVNDKTPDSVVTPPDTTDHKELYIFHKVKKGEGLFRIAVIYETTQEKIKELNPEATKKLRPGMLLRIPAKKKDKLTYVVRKGDTFYSLTHKYKVSEQDLLRDNPDLADGLKVGMVLVINPGKTEVTPSLAIHDSLQTTPISVDAFTDSISYNKNLHISFLLPVMSDKKVDYSSKKDSKLRNICTDFYMGAELAIDSLKKQGLPIVFHVYDTKNDPMEIYRIAQDESLKNSDALIGPFFFANAQKIARQFPDLPVITPLFSKKQNEDKTRNIIKAAVDKKDLLSGLTHYLKTNYDHQKILIITDTDPKNTSRANQVKSALLQQDSISFVRIIHPKHNKRKPTEIYMDKDELQKGISEKTRVWILLLSDNNIVTSDVVNTYGVLAKRSNIRLFTPQKFDDFSHLDFQFLGDLNWTFPATEFEQLDTDNMRIFNHKFREKNFAEPSIFAYSGFDLTYDTLMRLARANNLKEGLELGVSKRLAHKYDYQKDPNSYTNKGVMIIGFNKDMNYRILE